jgi:hypothetical protein
MGRQDAFLGGKSAALEYNGWLFNAGSGDGA